MVGLFRYLFRVFQSQRALTEVRTAFGTALQAGIGTLPDQTISEILGRLGL